jgi:hypothetical protein
MSSARRLTGIGATVAALAIVLTGCFPPKAPPPPPPKFKLAAGLWRTAGTADGATDCHFARIAADGSVITDVHSDHGARYVETADTDSEFVTSGCQPWTQYDGSEQPGGTVAIPDTHFTPPDCCQIFMPRRGFKDGDYIVGHEIFAPPPQGNVTGDVDWGYVELNVFSAGANGLPVLDASKVEACHWQKVGDWTGTTALASGDGNGDGDYRGTGWLQLHEGQGIRLTDCNGMFWASIG